MNAAQVNLNRLPGDEAGPVSPEQALSALVDGELDATGLDGVLASVEGEPATLASWHSYLVIGDVLRGAGVVVAAQPPDDFLAGVRERLRSEPVPVVEPMAPVVTQVKAAQVVAVRAPAANDALFRWKAVAGLASLAAVMAVGWSMLSGVPSGSGGASPQLAAAPVATDTNVSVAANAPASSAAVVVNTGQGPLIRDARLEELLAEHRQNGGMSALQMPTGFIRNATYDAAGR
ncbi:MAG: sigma-E factor negative regulatory protein [Hydrogenophaga sp.]|nr:sigma-E factor negative regulatory protein [Hydrogenophaga sp.]